MKFSVRDMVFTALYAAVLCAAAPFSITIGPVPLTLATLIVYIAAGSLDWKYGVLSVVLYIALGAVGIPVFSNFEGGFHKIAGLTGGFIIGYIPCALASGLIPSLFRNKPWMYALGMVIGTALLYTCGVAWYMLQTRATAAASIAVCAAPFLPGDAVKITAAYITAPRLRNALLRTAGS